jgi:hypothetical protein
MSIPERTMAALQLVDDILRWYSTGGIGNPALSIR